MKTGTDGSRASTGSEGRTSSGRILHQPISFVAARPGRVGTGYYRIRTVFYRIWTDFYRIATGYYRINFGFYRLLPHITASYRINFFGAGKEEANHRDTEAQSQAGRGFRSQEPEGESSAELCGKNYGFLRGFPQFYAFLRTGQGRIYAIFGFPSPPQVRCPKWVVRLRETWSHFYGWEPFFVEATHYWKEFRTESAAMECCYAA